MIIAGNWKMNMDRAGAKELVAALMEWRLSSSRDTAENPAMILFPPAILIDTAAQVLSGASAKDGSIALGGQDCHAASSGAHTGDIAAAMLADAGCSWVLVGHSERRQDHHETSSMVADKAAAGIAAGLKPMICVGEHLAERDRGEAFDIVAEQLHSSLPKGAENGGFAIAYEPVWAIGTGKVASPDDVAAMHNHIHTLLCGINPDYAAIPILYGGSVKPDNAPDLLALDHVGGALVGGASLKAEDFIAIAEAAS